MLCYRGLENGRRHLIETFVNASGLGITSAPYNFELTIGTVSGT
jgi:hypothetical protein